MFTLNPIDDIVLFNDDISSNGIMKTKPMKTTILISFFFSIIITSSGCDSEPSEPEPESQVGTLHLTVRYQTNREDSIPDVGSDALLFDEDAHSVQSDLLEPPRPMRIEPPIPDIRTAG